MCRLREACWSTPETAWMACADNAHKVDGDGALAG